MNGHPANNICSTDIYQRTQLTFPNLTFPNLTFPNLTFPNLTFPNLTFPNLTLPKRVAVFSLAVERDKMAEIKD